MGRARVDRARAARRRAWDGDGKGDGTCRRRVTVVSASWDEDGGDEGETREGEGNHKSESESSVQRRLRSAHDRGMGTDRTDGDGILVVRWGERGRPVIDVVVVVVGRGWRGRQTGRQRRLLLSPCVCRHGGMVRPRAGTGRSSSFSFSFSFSFSCRCRSPRYRVVCLPAVLVVSSSSSHLPQCH
jgi:hypothetical protein